MKVVYLNRESYRIAIFCMVSIFLFGCTSSTNNTIAIPKQAMLTSSQIEENIKFANEYNDGAAAYALAQYYEAIGDTNQKYQWLEKAANLGSKDASLLYASYLLVKAQGNKEIINKALQLLEANINSDNPRTIDYVWLADAYTYGGRIDVDLEKALGLYKKSAAMGDKLSITYVKLIEDALANNEKTLISPLNADCGVSQPLHNPTSRYVINGDEVYDKQTDLTWQRCSVGQVWKEGSGCEGSTQTFTFDKAQELSNKKWRVPNRYELVTLVERSCKAPSINRDVFPNMDIKKGMYWSSSTGLEGHWFILFNRGEVISIGDFGAFACSVRLVRSGR